MITVLTGGNDFALHQALKEIDASFDGNPERTNGSALTLADIPDLLMGVSLFAEKRLVVIDQLSDNQAVWQKLPDWLPRLSDSIHLVLLEPALDKRTTTYKALKSSADIRSFAALTSKDTVTIETWLVHYASERGVDFDRQLSKYLVGRVGLDQWRLSQAIDILALTGDTVTPAVIDAVIVPSLEESAFQLIEDALNGRSEVVMRTVQSLELSEEPHRLMALIMSQVFSLVAATLAPKDADPAKDFGVHPYVVSKLRRFSSSLGSAGALSILSLCAQADADLKISKAEPWVIVERLLMKIAHRVH